MARLLRMLTISFFVLLIPILPFLAFGAKFDDAIRRWQESTVTREMTVFLVVGLLATDILLPVPSSLISTLSGARLGWLGGTSASWLGMTIGAVIGFGLARRWGRPAALWFTRDSDLEAMKEPADRYGGFILVAARAVPVLAEASVLLLGIHRMSWSRFLPPLLLSNLGLALAYAAFGDFAGRHQWLPTAMGVAVAVPLLLAGVAHRFFIRSPS